MDAMVDLADGEHLEQTREHLLKLTKDRVAHVITSRELLSDAVAFVYQVWCTSNDREHVQLRNNLFFGDWRVARDRFCLYSETACAMHRIATQYEDSHLCEQLSQVSANVLWGYESTVQTYRQLHCNTPEVLASLPVLRMDSFFAPIVNDDMKSHQWLIRYYLEECGRRRYRRFGTGLFLPKYTDGGEFTRTYVYEMEVAQFVFQAVYPYAPHERLFMALTERPGTVGQCVKYLEGCYDDNLPTLTKDRTKFSYLNGLYDARTNVFYPYGVEPVGWARGVVCAKYFDMDFEYELYELKLRGGNPLAIPTPNVDKMLIAQDFPPEVCFWMFAVIGRLIFPVGDIDGWEISAFFKGVAGTGKSTMLRLAAKFYHDSDVGNLMSGGRKDFGIQHLLDKNFFICLDVDRGMHLDMTTWNQMVSGENVTVDRKGISAVDLLWKAGNAMAGNTYPPWQDQSGNLGRRMLNFIYTHVVKDVDPQLFKKCYLEMGAFMKKCVTCYHMAVERHGKRGIWDHGVLPQYFHDTRRQMQAENDPLQAFMISEFCMAGDDAHVLFNTFRDAFSKFCSEMRLPKKRLTDDVCNALFERQNIRVVEVPRDANPDDHFGYSGKYLCGIRLC
jgi:hypothetical protein